MRKSKFIPVGSRVVLRKTSEYYGEGPHNPDDTVIGTVEDRTPGHKLNYRVRWDNGSYNAYSRSDLRYYRGAKRERKVVRGKGAVDVLLEDMEILARAYGKGRAPGEVKPVVVPKPPQPEEKKKQVSLDYVLREARKEMDGKGRIVTARYAFIFKDRTYKVPTNTACHASMNYVREATGGKSQSDVEYVLTCISRSDDFPVHYNGCKFEREDLITYYKWLMEESPYASAFCDDQDVEEAFDSGYALCRTDVPANLLQGALITTRQVWEHPNIVKLFLKMVEGGVRGNEAYIIGCHFRIDKGGKVEVSRHGGGHHALDPSNMGYGDVEAFCQNKPHVLGKPYNEGGEVYQVYAMFENGGGERRWPEELLKKVGASKKAITTNPFAVNQRAVDSVSVSALAEYVSKKGLV